jgi:hypothetical protein
MNADGRLEVIPIDFQGALDRTAGQVRYLLLGNGFSISARPSFKYDSLFAAAQPFSSDVAELFERLKTQDFEVVLDHLLERIGGASSAEAIAYLRAKEHEVRERFIGALSDVHPHSSASLTERECDECASFLESFVGKTRGKLDGRIFTTNYDLLLYWVLVRRHRRLTCYDAHFNPPGNKSYGVWNEDSFPGVVYLHGALHLYLFGDQQRMLRYDGQRSLIEQTRLRLDAGEFPQIVSEGTSDAKVSRIVRSRYLTFGRKSFNSALLNRNGALFTFGHGLDPRDQHFLRRIGERRIGSVFLGVLGGLDSEGGDRAQYWAQRWSSARRAQATPQPLEVFVFDSSKVFPWG